MDKYHGIIFGGSDLVVDQYSYGYIRQPAPYKLRTLAKKAGYNIKAIDFSQQFTKDELTQVLENLVTKDTLFIGFSAALYQPQSDIWYSIYNTIYNFVSKSEYSPQIVVGGFKSYFKRNMFMKWDWIFSGYVDYDFIQWLHFLSGKPNTLKWKNLMGYKWVDGDSNHQNFDKEVTDNIEIDWLPEDHIQPYESLPIEISRGCRFACDFCEYPLLRSKQSDFDGIRSMLGKQISSNYEKWGVTNYWFDDFTFNSHQGKLDLIDNVNKDTGVKIKFSTFIRPELLVSWPEQQQQLVEQGLNGVGFGMETITKSPKVRSSISKGGDIDRINDAVSYMRKISNRQTSFLYLMMLGIPGQTIQDMENDHKFVKESEFVDSWNFHAFRFGYADDGNFQATVSKVTQNPEKYGYTKDLSERAKKYPNDLGDRYVWKNEHTSFLDVLELEQQWQDEDEKLQKVGGFNSQYFRSMGYDVDTNIGLKTVGELNMDELGRHAEQRVSAYIKDILSEKVTA
jgi:hypothetical protein